MSDIEIIFEFKSFLANKDVNITEPLGPLYLIFFINNFKLYIMSNTLKKYFEVKKLDLYQKI